MEAFYGKSLLFVEPATESELSLVPGATPVPKAAPELTPENVVASAKSCRVCLHGLSREQIQECTSVCTHGYQK